MQKRKETLITGVGRLIEKLDLFKASDHLFAGMFLELQTALKENSSKLKEWEKQGERFLRPNSSKKSSSTEANQES
ncbi:MAG: hypothetical protein HKM07_05310 [Chlamydiae bacterium]|nr:hypothetical protein [Chlamydiota bacterium]